MKYEDYINTLFEDKVDWYRYAIVMDAIEREAGLKENMVTALLVAVLLVLTGSGTSSAIKRTKVNPQQLEVALKDPKYINRAYEIIESMKKGKSTPLQKKLLPQENLPRKGINLSDIIKQLKAHEGYRNKAYLDPNKKNLVVGVGFNLDRGDAAKLLKGVGADYYKVRKGQPLTDAQIMALLKYDIEKAIKNARNFVSNFDNLLPDAQMVLIDMAFNMGFGGLSGFIDFKSALLREDFKTAAEEMRDSLWYKQVGNRGQTLVNMMGNLA